MGGTAISKADAAVGQYWGAASSTSNSGTLTLLTSALSYIPEIAWNDNRVNKVDNSA